MEKRARIDQELLLAQAGWVRGLAGSLVRDPLGAEDVAQETLLAALAAPGLRADDERTLRAWLARVVTNLSRLSVRGNARRRSRERVAARPERTASTSETVERAAQLQGVVDAVLELDEPYRSTVLLRFFEGLGYEEIGRRTGANAVAVRKRLSRGLEQLRGRLDEEFNGDREAWRAAFLPLALEAGARFEPIGEALAGPAAGPGASGVAGWAPVGVQAAAIVVAALTLSGLSSLALRPGDASGAAAPEASPSDGTLVSWTRSRQPAPAPLASTGAGRAERGVALDRERERSGPEFESRTPGEPSREQEPASGPAIRGRVVSLGSTGLGGLEVRAAGFDAVLATSTADGSFTVTAERVALAQADGSGVESALLEARAPASGPGAPVATVRSTALGATAPLVVAAPAVRVGGWVLDATGAPVPDARLTFEATDAAFVDLWLTLEGTSPAQYAADADAAGRFDFAALPTHPGLELVVRAPGFADLRQPVPEWSRLDLDLRLGGGAGDFVEGLVLLPDGSPAVGALVRAGDARARTDAAGRYRLRVDPARGPRVVVADLDGWQPADGPLWDADTPVNGAGGGARTGNGPTLVLPGPLLNLPGRAFDPTGRPAQGWTVAAVDESGDGSHAGLGGTDETGLNTGTHAGPHGGPGVAAWAITDASGGFVLRGLLDRDYVVVAYEPGGGAVAGPSTAWAGAGALLLPSRPTRLAQGGSGMGLGPYTGGGPAFGPSGPSADAPSGASSLPAPFAVPHRPRGALAPWSGQPAAAALALTGASATRSTPSASGAGTAWFLFAGGSFEQVPDALEARDAAGGVLELTAPAGSVDRLRLTRGRSPAVSVSDTAHVLVLFHSGAELARLPLRLETGELTVVNGWRGGRGLGGASVGARRTRDRDAGAPEAERGGFGQKSASSAVTVGASRQP